MRGWCFSKSKKITSVRIITKSGTQITRYGIERHDLLEAYKSKDENVLYSGFEVPLKLDRGSTKFTLEAKDEDEKWYPLITEYLVRPQLKFMDPEASLRSRHPYTLWYKEHDTLSAQDKSSIKEHSKKLENRPLISVVVPTYNTPIEFLDKMIQSVRDQLYDNWELCIADDNSPDNKTIKRLKYWESKDSRIRICYRTENGHISACTNSAIELVKGDYIALLDHDDEIPPHALYWIALTINKYPETKIIYSDEDKITPDGYRLDPYLKPDFGPDLLGSHNFVSHLGAYKTELIHTIKGFREDFVGSQDWDLVLRCLDHVTAEQIQHIPRILYHWRLSNDSTSSSVGNKGYAVDSGKRALEEYLAKREPNAYVTDGPTFGSFRLRYKIENDPLVSIIILTKDKPELITQCVDTLIDQTEYKNYELLIVDNGSTDKEALEYLNRLESSKNVSVLKNPAPFNFSALNNWAVKKAKGEILLFLNNDMEIVETDWLSELVSHAQRPGVGPVGAKLLFPDEYVQHAGVILGIQDHAGHAFKYLHRSNPGQIGRAGIIQNYSAVTAACMAVKKSTFVELGGFDEINLGIAYNDIDFCLRAGKSGYRTVYTPYSLLIHHESASRGLEDNSAKKARWEKEAAHFRSKWQELIDDDPYYNPALALHVEDFSLAHPPRYTKPWEAQ